jgi:hypothetical protein
VKNFITLALLCFSLAGFAQTEENVEKNDLKINELNERLDNLLGSSKSISGDSVNYKLDLLFKEIQSLKTEMQSLLNSVDEIKANGIPNSSQAKIDKINSKIEEIEIGEYYVVLASERLKERAERYLARYEHTQKLRVVQNVKGSWFHVIIDQPQDMRSAIETSNALRAKDVKDAWWVTGKKLKRI